jgi:nicotinamide-nucleotide amidase
MRPENLGKAGLEYEVGEKLHVQKLTIGVVESATGGLISHLFTNAAGSSCYFKGAVIAYSNEVKIKLVGVDASTIEKYGAVSSQVAEEMALGGRKLLDADICVADTGIAGPTGATPDKPLGLFYLGFAHKGGVFSRRHVFSGSREDNKRSAAEAILLWLNEYLSKGQTCQ